MGKNAYPPLKVRAPLANDIHTTPPIRPITPMATITTHTGLPSGGGTFSGVGKATGSGLISAGGGTGVLRGNPNLLISVAPIPQH